MVLSSINIDQYMAGIKISWSKNRKMYFRTLRSFRTICKDHSKCSVKKILSSSKTLGAGSLPRVSFMAELSTSGKQD